MSDSSPARGFSNRFIAAFVAVCLLPSILRLAGVSFGASGPFLHKSLELVGITTGVLTAFLAYGYHRINRDFATPIIAMALLWSAGMDLIHVLSSAGVFTGSLSHGRYTDLTLSVSVFFNALAIAVIVGITMGLERVEVKRHLKLVVMLNLLFASGAFLFVWFVLSDAPPAPGSVFSNAVGYRAYELPSLFIFVATGIFVIYPFHRREQTLFSHALLLSLVPGIIAEVELTFFCRESFDGAYNAAHLLKVVGYLVPFFGVSLEYLSAYRRAELLAEARIREVQSSLLQRNEQLSAEVLSRQQVEKTLLESEEHYRRLAQALQDPILTIDESQKVLFANRATEKMLGYSHGEVLGHSFLKLLQAESQPAFLELVAKFFRREVPEASGETLLVQGRHRGGRAIALDLSAAELGASGRPVLALCLRDLSARKPEGSSAKGAAQPGKLQKAS